MDQKEKAPGHYNAGGGGPIQGKDGFVLYKSLYGPISHLTAEQKGKLLDAIFQWQITGSAELSADIDPYFRFFQARFMSDNDKYLEMCRRRQDYGRMGGRPRKASTFGESIRFSEKQMLLEKAKEADKDRIGGDRIGNGFNDTALSGASLNPKGEKAKSGHVHGRQEILKMLEEDDA